MSKRKTQEEFIREAKAIHGDDYDYSKVVLVDMSTRVILNCEEHGDFSVVPSQHIHKRDQIGCTGCGRKNQGHPLTVEQVLEKFHEVHGELYDYSLMEYTGMHFDIQIKCERCQKIFPQRPDAHIYQKQGCPDCGLANRSSPLKRTPEKFLAEVIEKWGDQCTYEKTEYINKETKIKYDCHKHGEIYQNPITHLKFGCPKCKKLIKDKS